ncbi:uncharacterized [Tachysurus ichikawai]
MNVESVYSSYSEHKDGQGTVRQIRGESSDNRRTALNTPTVLLLLNYAFSLQSGTFSPCTDVAGVQPQRAIQACYIPGGHKCFSH